MTDLLEQHFSQLTNPVDDSDWRAIRRRARRPGRRVTLAAAAVVAAGLLVAPALGIGDRVLDLIRGEPAPRPVQESFAASNEFREQVLANPARARQGLAERFPRVIADQARGVAALDTVDGPIYLWVAPTEAGLHCWLIQTGEQPGTGRPHGHGSCDDGEHPFGPLRPGGPGWDFQRPNVKFLHVRVYDEEITRVDVELDGAAPMSLRVVSGHVLATVPLETRSLDVVVGRNAGGEEVARYTRPTFSGP
jgi:hypothetical protein